MSTYPPPPPGSFPGPPPGYTPPQQPPYQQPPAYPPPPPPGGYQPQPPQHQTYGATPPPAKKSWMLWVGAGCGCFLLAMAIFAGVIFMGVKAGTAGAETVVKDFLKAAGEGRYAEAYDHFSAPLQATQSFDDFQSSASSNSHLFRVKDTTFNQRSVDTTSANLSGSLTLESGTDVPAKFDLVQENGAWKLLNYSIGSND